MQLSGLKTCFTCGYKFNSVFYFEWEKCWKLVFSEELYDFFLLNSWCWTSYGTLLLIWVCEHRSVVPKVKDNQQMKEIPIYTSSL